MTPSARKTIRWSWQHRLEGVVRAEAGADIHLNAVDGDLRVDTIEAGGDARLEALQSILATRANELAGDVTATNLELVTRIGGVGEASRLLGVDTDGVEGRVDVDSADTLYMREVAGDLRLGQAAAGGDEDVAFIFSEGASSTPCPTRSPTPCSTSRPWVSG